MRGNNKNENSSSLTGLRKTRGGYLNASQKKQQKIKKYTKTFIDLIEDETFQIPKKYRFPDITWQKSNNFYENLKKDFDVVQPVLENIMKEESFYVKNAGSVLATLHYSAPMNDHAFNKFYNQIISSFDREEKSIFYGLVQADNNELLTEKETEKMLLNECFYKKEIQGTDINSRTFFKIWSNYFGVFKSSSDSYTKVFSMIEPKEIFSKAKHIRHNYEHDFGLVYPSVSVVSCLNDYFERDIDDFLLSENSSVKHKQKALNDLFLLKESVYDRLDKEFDICQDTDFIERFDFTKTLINCVQRKISFKQSYYEFLAFQMRQMREKERQAEGI